MCRARLQPDGLKKPVLTPSLHSEQLSTDREESGEGTVQDTGREGDHVVVYSLLAFHLIGCP